MGVTAKKWAPTLTCCVEEVDTPCNIVPQFPFLAVSTPAFWDILVPLFPFPLFHVSHFQRPRSCL